MIKNPELKEAAKTVSEAVSRVWGFANALCFLSEIELPDGQDKLRASSFKNALDELSQAIKDALSPALEASTDLLCAFDEEGVE